MSRKRYLISALTICSAALVVDARILCDADEVPCRHNTTPQQDNVDGVDDIFRRPTAEPTSPPAPTAEPTSPPAPIPLPPCPVDDTGFYGDDTLPASKLEFFYEVQVTAGTTASDVNDQILGKVEKALVGSVLPDVFSGTCGDGVARRRLASVTGISAQGPDLVLPGVSCAEVPTDGSECYMVDAVMTVFGEDTESFEKQIKESIQTSITRGDLNDVDERVVAIQYADETEVDKVVDGSTGTLAPIQADTGSAKKVPVWGLVLIGIAAVLALALMSACPSPCCKGDEEDEDSARVASLQQQEKERLREEEHNEVHAESNKVLEDIQALDPVFESGDRLPSLMEVSSSDSIPGIYDARSVDSDDSNV